MTYKQLLLTDDKPRLLAHIQEVVNQEDSVFLFIPLQHLQELLERESKHGSSRSNER
jgi:hypothetical protein